jgi:hypothetical protein
MRTSILVALLVASAVVLVDSQTRKVEFTEDAAGQPPKGFEFGHTAAKAGAPGKWVVQAEGANKYLAQIDPDNTRHRRYNEAS